MRVSDQIRAAVTIRPMTPAADDESGTGMAVDEPRAGETALGAITVAGWAPDPQVWTGLEAGFREEARDRELP